MLTFRIVGILLIIRACKGVWSTTSTARPTDGPSDRLHEEVGFME